MKKLPDSHTKKINSIIQLAKQENWYFYTHNKITMMLSFKKSGERINVFYTKMTVATCVFHPRFGKTQLFRKNVSMKELADIFKNPRTHTDKGYYTKDGIKLGKSFILKKEEPE